MLRRALHWSYPDARCVQTSNAQGMRSECKRTRTRTLNMRWMCRTCRDKLCAWEKIRVMRIIQTNLVIFRGWNLSRSSSSLDGGAARTMAMAWEKPNGVITLSLIEEVRKRFNRVKCLGEWVKNMCEICFLAKQTHTHKRTRIRFTGTLIDIKSLCHPYPPPPAKLDTDNTL